MHCWKCVFGTSFAKECSVGVGDGLGCWWGLTSSGEMHSEGESIGNPLPSASCNSNGVAFGPDEEIDIVLDMERGTMRFFRDGLHIQGADIFDVPTKDSRMAPLHLVAGITGARGASVRLSASDRLAWTRASGRCQLHWIPEGSGYQPADTEAQRAPRRRSSERRSTSTPRALLRRGWDRALA